MDFAYFMAMGACTGAAATLWLSPPRWLVVVCWVAAFAALSALLLQLGMASGHLPIFGERLEAPLAVAWTLCLMGMSAQFVLGWPREARLAMLGVALCVFSTRHVPPAPHPDAFWYTHWAVFVFFFFRVLAVSGVLFSGACYGAALLESEGSAERKTRAWMGRNILLAGIVLFGVSELAGCIWALRGWGEFWLFNPGFMSSAGSFLLLLIPLHLSGRWTRDPKVLPTVGALCSVIFVQYVMLRMH